MSAETRGTILVAESDKDQTWLYRHWLWADGFESKSAHSGSAMARILRASPIDLLLLDLNLPGLDTFVTNNGAGFKSISGELPVVGMAGALDRMAHGLAERSGVENCLAKPFCRIELEMAVVSALGLDERLALAVTDLLSAGGR